MKPFDLDKAIAGHPLVTRDGREVTEFHYFKTAIPEYGERVMAVVDGDVFTYIDNGKYINGEDLPEDLFLKSEKKTLWIAIENEPLGIQNQTTHAYINECHIDDFVKVKRGWQKVKIEIEV